MSKIQKRITLFYTLTASVVALVVLILRTVALLTEYEAVSQFYSSPSLAIATAAILTAAGLAFAFFAYELREHFSFSPDYRDLPSLASGVFLAVTLLFFAVTLVMGALFAPTATLIFAILTALAACAGTAVLILRAFDGRVGTARAAMLTLPMAALGVLFALYLSLETSVMLTSPVKLLATATWVFVTFFFLGEARLALCRAKWALHLSVTAMTVILSGTLSIPNLIYHAVNGAPLLSNTAHDFLALGLFLYTAARFAAILTAPAASASSNTAATAEEKTDEEALGR